ncbi:MAG: BREX-1 system phosphatase PglZ type A [Streptococcaceae bacterium]|jgi:uncharacterized protein (TIGR02687 family)|nr:BREX-1 system phosphatase PglZ type A [Streptococcaceae bacterium]
MADLKFMQIEDKLNSLFQDYGQRKIEFWFDPKQDFIDDVKTMSIQHAELLILEEDALFKYKRYIEYEKPTTNFLVYAPFNRWDNQDESNHLLSILMYSGEFHADKLAIIMNELSIPMEFHDVLLPYSSFFNAKDRNERLSQFSTEFTSSKNLEAALMGTLLKTNSIRIYDLLRTIYLNFTNGNKDPFSELEKFNLKDKFWEFVGINYGYQNDEPSLEKLSVYLFINYFYYQIGEEIPDRFKQFDSQYLRNNVVTFMDQYMNDSRFTDSFDRLSEKVFKAIDGEQLLNTVKIDDLIQADIFEQIDNRILTFFTERLSEGDNQTKIGDLSIYQNLDLRGKRHFSIKYKFEYQLLKHASYLIDIKRISGTTSSNEFVQMYENELFWIDTHYRKFIWNYDRIEDKHKFEQLYRLIENNYSTFINHTGQIWNQELDISNRPSIRDFYRNNITSKSKKTAVIISDAFRFELGKDLQRIFDKEKKYSASIEGNYSLLPSVTEFGKAALLPNKELSYITGTEVLVDGMKTNGLANRQSILEKTNDSAISLNYDDVYNLGTNDLRELFRGKNLIYIYHDQIDKTGDHGTEKQVFDAARKSIQELRGLIKTLTNGNVERFIVTADHGFIYHRGKVEEVDKIENPSQNSNDRVERRFIITDEIYSEIGTKNYRIGEWLGNDDQRNICVPLTSSIFKKAGGGQNYVHGGSSVQEVLVPVVEINYSKKGSRDKEDVQVELMSSRNRIVGLSTTLEFHQKNPVNDEYAPVTFKLYFVDEKGERISNEVSYVADSKETDGNKRFSKFIFEFVNRRYLIEEKYYLVLNNVETNVERRISFVIDNPFAQDFDFGF